MDRIDVTRIGDCLAPSTIAAAVYAGHRYARELDAEPVEGTPFRRELPALDPDFHAVLTAGARP